MSGCFHYLSSFVLTRSINVKQNASYSLASSRRTEHYCVRSTVKISGVSFSERLLEVHIEDLDCLRLPTCVSRSGLASVNRSVVGLNNPTLLGSPIPSVIYKVKQLSARRAFINWYLQEWMH
ncbi:hypothetical protein P879_03246 [Paragonimus westermani]|uniref:Uncharacterized protein n=1 Tax=Paragonimus westermani TaxID=34504 RepID=A0A8T0DQL6_9TREM|nr:hypothetical protein P879_03246 [Paragonimus westermani]